MLVQGTVASVSTLSATCPGHVGSGVKGGRRVRRIQSESDWSSMDIVLMFGGATVCQCIVAQSNGNIYLSRMAMFFARISVTAQATALVFCRILSVGADAASCGAFRVDE